MSVFHPSAWLFQQVEGVSENVRELSGLGILPAVLIDLTATRVKNPCMYRRFLHSIGHGRNVFLVLLLVVSFGAMLALAWQAVMAQRSHYASARAVMTDYSELVADAYQRRLTSSAGLNSLYRVMQIEPQNVPRPLAEVLPRHGIAPAAAAFMQAITALVAVDNQQVMLLAGAIAQRQQAVVTAAVLNCLRQIEVGLLSCYRSLSADADLMVIVGATHLWRNIGSFNRGRQL